MAFQVNVLDLPFKSLKKMQSTEPDISLSISLFKLFPFKISLCKNLNVVMSAIFIEI